MRLSTVSARAHPHGNRIDLAWANPDPAPPGYALRIGRGQRSYPETPHDGTVINPAPGASSHSDRGLHGETVYYYTFFPSSDRRGDDDDWVAATHPGPHHRVAAMATSPYGV